MEDRVHFEKGSALTPKPKQWLWPSFVPLGALTILAGDPGSGKSTILMDIAAAITVGGLLPDGTVSSAGHVIVYAPEDHKEDTIIPRLLANGADVSRILFPNFTTKEGIADYFDVARDIDVLSETLDQFPSDREDRIRLLITDPIISATETGGTRAVRSAMEQLAQLAERHNIAVIGVAHFAKDSGNKNLLDRVSGSLSYTAVARMVLAATKLPNGFQTLGKVKTNITDLSGHFPYMIEDGTITAQGVDLDTTRIVWGERQSEALHEAINPPQNEPDGALRMAMSFLSDVLANGPVPYNKVMSLVAEQPFSLSSIQRAKKMLGIMSRKRSDGWWWVLPGQNTGRQEHKASEYHEHLEHLEYLPAPQAA
ncbi:AAA family ATPase [Granulicella mallensis]|uniref:Putative DNA primase/helicase n=1 Tax=Granulicella mallensis TaxID=940614 RepID=A0A7W7ZU32_9BACT|nr:AAA family ATPase [Granulicella mallensis]MBB5066172.1 putative DNA primase/helicase [Granulicella mallensis]